MGEKTPSQKKAQQKYMEKFAVARVRMERKHYEQVQAYAEAHSESVNGFINRAIDASMGVEPSKMPASGPVCPPLSQGVVLPPEALETAQQAIEATGEVLEGFVCRSVDEQAKRDRISLQMGIDPVTRKRKGGFE